MNNTHLSRRVDNAKRDFEDIIDEIIAEVEELECDKDKMQDEIDSLNATIEKMAERISELESAQGKNKISYNGTMLCLVPEFINQQFQTTTNEKQRTTAECRTAAGIEQSRCYVPLSACNKDGYRTNAWLSNGEWCNVSEMRLRDSKDEQEMGKVQKMQRKGAAWR